MRGRGKGTVTVERRRNEKRLCEREKCRIEKELTSRENGSKK